MSVRTGSPPSFCGRSRTPRTLSVGATFQLPRARSPRPRPGWPRSSGRSAPAGCRGRSVRTCGQHCDLRGPIRDATPPDLRLRLPEQWRHRLGRVRTYVRFLHHRGSAVSRSRHPPPRASRDPGPPGTPRRAGRPGPAHDAGRRADPAGAHAARPALPQRLPAPRHHDHRLGAARPRRDDPGARPPGRGIGRRELVCRRGPARPRRGRRGRPRARSAPGRLRAPPRHGLGRGGR